MNHFTESELLSVDMYMPFQMAELSPFFQHKSSLSDHSHSEMVDTIAIFILAWQLYINK